MAIRPLYLVNGDSGHSGGIEVLRERLEQMRGELEQLRKEKDLYHSILENIPADIVGFDPNHRYAYINPMAVRDEKVRRWMIGKDDFEYCRKRNKPVELAQQRRQVFEQVAEEGETREWVEKLINQKGETEYHLRRMYPKFGKNNELEFMIGYALDVTKEMTARDELIRAREEAERASRAKTEFLSKMTHEIRTPLNAIIGFTDILLEEGPSAEQMGYLRNMKHSADALLGIINDILDFSKIEAGHLEVFSQPFNLKQSLKSMAGAFQLRAEQKGLEFKVVVDEDVPEGVVGDQVKLNQVLLNLLGNAFKFTERGHITLTVEAGPEDPQGRLIYFKVEDSGIGITREKLPTIFNSFTQAEQDTSRRYGGTGLGLTITKSLVEAQGGEISVMSILGKGSTFQFCIPYHSMDPEAMAGYVHRQPLDLSGRRILVAEDNELNQIVLGRMLKHWNGSATMVVNGKAALNLLENESFDLVLMDLQMPEMDGLQATRAWRTREQELGISTPIVALTADAFTEARESVLCAGMDDFVSKPINREALERVLRRFLG